MLEGGRRTAISTSQLGLYSDHGDPDNRSRYGSVARKFAIGVMVVVAVILVSTRAKLYKCSPTIFKFRYILFFHYSFLRKKTKEKETFLQGLPGIISQSGYYRHSFAVLIFTRYLPTYRVICIYEDQFLLLRPPRY